MRLVKIDDLNGSEVLAVPIMSAKDQVLIQSDTVLRGEYIDKLRKYNIPSVYIKDDVKFDVEATLQNSRKVVESILERHIYKHNDELKRIGEQANKIIDSVLSEPEVLESVTDIRNISTDMYSHCINVCVLSTILALRLKMNERQVRNVSMGAILHDIGLKYIQVPYIDISVSQMRASDVPEYKKHTIYGYSSIQEEEWISDVSKEIILLHHEQVDGEGFPFKQKGDKLKSEVKIVSICDDYDSLISGIGNKKIKVYQAIEYIRVNAGKKYDSTIAAKFLETIAWYPVGIKVVLNDGDVGIVIRQNKDSTDRPVIKMLTHADGSEYNPQTEIDLLKKLTLFVVDTL